MSVERRYVVEMKKKKMDVFWIYAFGNLQM